LFPLQSVPRALLGTSRSTIPRQRFLRGPVPGYITRVFSEVSGWMASDAMSSAVTMDSVDKGCQKSGYSDCRVVVRYSVVSCKTEGVRRDSVVLKCT
jgi:hypothetical protein